MSFMTHLECARCAKEYPAGQIHNLCECGSTLFARYDLRRVSTKLEPQTLKSRARDLWRYREVLPVANESSIISLGGHESIVLFLTATGYNYLEALEKLS